MPGIQQSQNPNISPLTYLNSNGSVVSDIKSELETLGSEYSYGNAGLATPFDPGVNRQNPLSTKQSSLHVKGGGAPGYSLNGTEDPINGTPLADAAKQYLDGNSINDLPPPATLDLDGTSPTLAGHGLNNPTYYSNNQLPYEDHMPPGGVI